jgi:hypothetical protein
MAIGQINPDVPSTAQLPDTYLYISTAPMSIGVSQPKDLFLVATGVLSGSQVTSAPYSLTAGTATPNEIRQYSDVTRANRAFHRKSPIANRFRNALQEVPIGINIFLAALAEPANSGFSGMATRLLTFYGTAAGSGQITLRVGGHECQIPVANGDQGAAIAASGKTAFDRYLLDCPMVSAPLIGAPLLTITGNATGSNLIIAAAGVSKTIAITAGWTPAQSATAIAAALAGDTAFPLTATSAAGVVSTSWRAGFPVTPVTVTDADTTQDYALTYASGSGPTLPLTYVVRGLDGNDCPVLIDIPPELTGISVSPGALLVSTTALGAAGSASLFTLLCDATAYVVSIPIGTTASQAAALIAAEINRTTGPLSATAVGAAVTLFYRPGWYVKKLQVSSTEDATGQTYTLADRHDSAGAISSVSTTAGSATATPLQGSGAPNLTTLLDNASKKTTGYSEWAVDYLDSTSTSAIYRHVEEYSNGFYQRNQRVTLICTDPLETAAAVATNASPQLGNSWRYSVGVYQGAACQGGAYAAQVAARLCATDLPYNVDGMQLVSGTIAPMLPGRSETDLSPPSQDVALGTYHVFPLQGVNGVVTVLRGKTVWAQSNTEWGDWSYGRIFDAVRFGMRAFLNSRFKGRVLFRGGGTVRVPNGFTAQDVKDAIGEYLDSIDGVICDGAKDLKRFIAVEPDPNNPGFLRIFFRERPPRELHIISGVVAAAA